MCKQEGELWGADGDEILSKHVKYSWALLHHSWPVQTHWCLAVSGRCVVHLALKEQFERGAALHTLVDICFIGSQPCLVARS